MRKIEDEKKKRKRKDNICPLMEGDRDRLTFAYQSFVAPLFFQITFCVLGNRQLNLSVPPSNVNGGYFGKILTADSSLGANMRHLQ